MAEPLRAHARAVLDAVLAAVEPSTLVVSRLAREPRPSGRVWVVGGGKAAAAMARGVERAWGPVAGGLVVVPAGTEVSFRETPMQFRGLTGRLHTVEVAFGGHPLPTPEGVASAARLEALLRSVDPEDTVVACISGGGSACLTLPVEGVDLEDLRERTEALLRSGAPIEEINAVRRSLSRLAHGGLARACRAPVLGLVLSDVVGDPLDTIASGPTLGARTLLVGGPGTALDAADRAAQALGYPTTRWAYPVVGEAREVGARLAAQLQGRGAWVGAGETTVTVTGTGRGGRNQEMALAAALVLDGRPGVFLSAGTDGIDGPTDAAGALVDGAIVQRMAAFGRDAHAALANNDAYPFLDAAGALLRTGPTGTNVADVQVGLVA